MMIVTVNGGSTSVKLAAFRAAGDGALEPLEQAHHTQLSQPPVTVMREFLAKLPGAPRAVAHRIVHGGTRFHAPVVIDTGVAAALEELSELAPLHNPQALAWVAAARQATAAEVAQIAVFDTAFFFTLPRVAAEYALPARFGTDIGVKRYGFHGLAHEAMWRRWTLLTPELTRGGRLISLQLGGGCSAAAIRQGVPLDTTMGFSPLEGLVMATRSGDLDPAVVPFLQKRLSMSSAQVIELLNHEAGVAGLSGGETDLGRLAGQSALLSQFAVELYCYRIRKYVGAFLAVLGGCDGIAFGGGVGEHVPAVRRRILDGLEWAGIRLDEGSNEAARGEEARISSRDSSVRIEVIPVHEEPLLAAGALVALDTGGDR